MVYISRASKNSSGVISSCAIRVHHRGTCLWTIFRHGAEAPSLGFSDALLAASARDGGLYVPSEWPAFTRKDIRAMRGQSYQEDRVPGHRAIHRR